MAKMAKRSLGAKTWLVPDCFLPEKSTGELESHESTCVLNVGGRAAALKFTAYFEDREPIAGLAATCPPRRTNHVRINRLRNAAGESIPRGVPFALLVESNVSVVVQHTRLDSTQPALALMTTMAFAV
jgi:hypothetical protein